MLKRLHSAISAANIPVVGVLIGDINDRSTWRADLDNGTAQQHAEAQAIIDAFDATKELHNGAIDAQIRAIESRELLPRAAREAILVGIAKDYMRDNAVGFPEALSALTTVGEPGYNAGFTKLYALDNQIKALRGQRQP